LEIYTNERCNLESVLKIIRYKIYRLAILLETDPFKVANFYRKLGVQIGRNTCIYRDVIISGAGAEPVAIGENCVLTGCVLLAHDASTNRYLKINYGELSPTAPIVVEDDCFIGYGAIVLMGVTIGKGSIVGAGAVVTKDVPSGSVVVGNPGKVVCSVNELVEKRRSQFIDRAV
jgi:maltose O-acetyltransferase